MSTLGMRIAPDVLVGQRRNGMFLVDEFAHLNGQSTVDLDAGNAYSSRFEICLSRRAQRNERILLVEVVQGCIDLPSFNGQPAVNATPGTRTAQMCDVQYLGEHSATDECGQWMVSSNASATVSICLLSKVDRP